MIDFDELVSESRFDYAAPMDVIVYVSEKDENGNVTGMKEAEMTIYVKSALSPDVSKFHSAEFNKRMQEEMLARKKGQQPKQSTLEELQKSNIEACAIRMAGWEGTNKEFKKEYAVQFFTKQSHLIQDVLNFSNEMRNFTKAS